MKFKIPIQYKTCIFLMGTFGFFRVYRNSINYNVGKIGGIWNIIGALFILFAAVGMIHCKSINKLPTSIKLAFLYSTVVIMNAIFTTKEWTFGYMYNIFMIPFFASVLLCFYFASMGSSNSRKEALITQLVFAALFFLTFISTFWFKTGKLEFVMVSNVYYLLCLLPIFLFYTSNKYVRILGYAAVLMCLVFSGKRGGLVAFVLFLLAEGFVAMLQSKNSLKTVKILGVSVIYVLIFNLIYAKLVYNFNLRIVERILNVAKDGGSGRLRMYEQLFLSIKESSITEWIFGHGYYSTEEILVTHDAAHNDFLETMYDYGVLPTILLLLFYCSLMFIAFKMLKASYRYTGYFLGSVFISLVLSTISIYCVTHTYVGFGMASIGVILADWEKLKIGQNVTFGRSKEDFHEIYHSDYKSFD